MSKFIRPPSLEEQLDGLGLFEQPPPFEDVLIHTGNGPPPEEPSPCQPVAREPAGAYARTTDPDTSKQAALRVDVTKREQQVVDAMQLLGGEGTSTEIAEAAQVDKWSISPRMKPLEAKGHIRRTDERRKGQIVWRLR